MSARLTTANLSESKEMKEQQPLKKHGTADSLYAGILSAQRAIQHQRSTSHRQSTQSKRSSVLKSIGSAASQDVLQIYYPWEPGYNRIMIREKRIKSMTKDSYTSMPRVLSHAVERVTTEMECCPPLIPVEAVKIQSVQIERAPRPIVPSIIRYLRRNELMPSERLVPISSSATFPLLSELQHEKSIISVTNVNKITGLAPTLATTDRLLNRAKMRNDSGVIRRPPRKLMMNATHETVMPLSVYG